MIRGGMQNWPLLIGTILDHAETFHPRQEVVSRLIEGPLHRTTYAEIGRRARQCGAALKRLGAGEGDRIATLAWNTHRHLEVWYGAGHIGAVYHTVNPRLFDEQIAYIVNDADDRIVLVDLTFIPLLERLRDKCFAGRKLVVLTDRANMPQSSLDLECYEDLLAAEDDSLPRAEIDENAPCGLCYTSGTTGQPKGVLYTHRSNVLHSLMVHGADVLGFTARSVILPVVPMYHANAWTVAFTAPMTGAKLVLPGARIDAESICTLFREEKVTMSAGVPTVWIDAIPRLQEKGRGTLERVLIGGSAAPRWMVEAFDALGIGVSQAWGMTEMSPIGTFTGMRPGMEALGADELMDERLKPGGPMYGVEIRTLDDADNTLPHDGESAGRIQVRGPCIVSEYFNGAGGEQLDGEGFFETGDIGTIDRFGFVAITDRTKDIIKSGGEWISSVELEGEAASHPGIREAAAIGVPHEKWGERPLLAVVRNEGSGTTAQEVKDWLAARVAKWWLPDEVLFIDDMPHTATGKLDKLTLRKRVAEIRGG